MQFQDEDIQKLAQLSRIKLTQHEVELFRDQLTSVLQYVEKVGTVDVSGMKQKGAEDARLRTDESRTADANAKDLLDAAPHIEEGHISVLSVK